MKLKCWLLIDKKEDDRFEWKGGVREPAFSRMKAAFPWMDTGYGNLEMKCDNLDLEDVRLKKIWHELLREGALVPGDRACKAPTIYFWLTRIYTLPEQEAAPYHIVSAADRLADIWLGPLHEREAADAPIVSRKEGLTRKAFGHLSPHPWAMIVRDEGKRALEKAKLKGLAFRRLPVDPPKRKMKVQPEVDRVALWRVWSEVILPPSKNLCFDNGGAKFHVTKRDAVFKAGCFPLEGFVINPELHYRREAMEGAGDFDIAMTCERFGNAEPLLRWAVVSRRFREVMGDLGYRIDCHPVRVDDDDVVPTGPLPSWWRDLMARQAKAQTRRRKK